MSDFRRPSREEIATAGERGRASANRRKRCTRCGEMRPMGQFRTLSTGRPDSWCRPCLRAANRASWQRRKERENLDQTVDAVLARLRPSDGEYARWIEAVSRWGASDPTPDEVLTDLYGTERWDRDRPGLASLLTLMAQDRRVKTEARSA